MEKSDIFRNTKNWYSKADNYASENLIKFAAQNAGNKILDVGCATGEYCVELKKQGFNCIGIDVNPEYVKKSNLKNVETYEMDATDLNFKDNSFDTVLLFEILEHVHDYHKVVEEARRVAKKNVLITVPNATQFNELKGYGLTYEHVLEEDHVNFFTKDELEVLLLKYFKNFKVKEREALNIEMVNLSRILRYLQLFLYKLRVVKPRVFFRLYAIALK